MAVLRTERTKGFTTIDNGVFMNKELSMKATGLLCTMLSLPDGWNYSIAGLASLFSDGESAVRSALDELKRYGYFRRRQVRENGRIKEIEYIVSEQPILVGENLVVDFPQQEILKQENLPQYNTNTINKEKNKRNSNKEYADIMAGLPAELVEALNHFMEMRKKIKSPMTPYALERLIKRVNRLSDGNTELAVAILDQSTLASWKNVYELKGEAKRVERRDEYAKAWAELDKEMNDERIGKDDR